MSQFFYFRFHFFSFVLLCPLSKFLSHVFRSLAFSFVFPPSQLSHISNLDRNCSRLSMTIHCIPVPLYDLIIITPWPETTSELYRPSDRLFLAKLVPILTDIWCRVAYGRNLGFLYRSRYFFFQVAPQLYS
jgi:hypothetical protein